MEAESLKFGTYVLMYIKFVPKTILRCCGNFCACTC